MPNFIQTCYIATDYTTKAPVLKEAKTKSGKDVFSGKITWTDGKNAEGKKLYQSVKFVTYKREIFSLFRDHSSAAFDIEGFLKIQNKEDKDKKWQTFVEVQIVKASIHVWEEKKPVAHFQETESDAGNWADE